MLPIVAIVGRPNVGKSTLFNQLTGTSAALVADIEGLTRDRIYGHIQSEKNDLIVIDTGGLDFDHGDLSQTIQEQTETAIEEADLVCFVVDGREGLANSDREVALDLRKKDKETILVVNKVEGMSSEGLEADFHSLGFKEMVSISAKRGDNCADLIGLIEQKIDQPDIDSTARELDENEMSIALVGRPNVGKSSLLNSICGEARSIVSPIRGTTRDAIDTRITHQGKEWKLVDTAGIRRRRSVDYGPEFFGINRSFKAIQRSDVCVLVIDALDGVTEQDQRLAGRIEQEGRACLIAINKWDAIEKDSHTMSAMEKDIRSKLYFLDWAEMIFTSALTGQRVEGIFSLASLAVDQNKRRVTTSILFCPLST